MAEQPKDSDDSSDEMPQQQPEGQEEEQEEDDFVQVKLCTKYAAFIDTTASTPLFRFAAQN
jgi:hypothetical protein